jgi:tetratricopeptide (TPR) repeat protein
MEDFEKALEISENVIKKAPNNHLGYLYKGESLKFLGKFKDSIEFLNKALKYTIEKSSEYSDVMTSRSDVFLSNENWENSILDAEKSQQISKHYANIVNKCAALKKLGRKEEAKKILENFLPETENIKPEKGKRYARAAVFALLDDKKNMLKELKSAIKKNNEYKVRTKYDAVFADYREDPDFRKLIYEEKQETLKKKEESEKLDF